MPESPLAIVVHAYYEDVFREILCYVDKLQGVEFKLYVTCPYVLEHSIGAMLALRGDAYRLCAMPNRGRDVLPFLCILPEIVAAGHQAVLKVHTKKSVHRPDGDVWRRELYESLLDSPSIRAALGCFADSASTGVLGPADHLVPIRLYWGSNLARVVSLAARLGLDRVTLEALDFFAGAMFLARIAALRPLLALGLTESDFEEESGQIDGTMAHAIERLIPACAKAVQLDTAVLPGSKRTTSTYRFAELVRAPLR